MNMLNFGMIGTKNVKNANMTKFRMIKLISLQNKLHDTIYENAKLKSQLFDKVSEQKDITKDMSANTKFANQSTSGTKLYSVTPSPNSKVIPKVVETNDLSKPVTSNSVPTPTESKVVTNDKVIAPGMFRINPFKTSREDKFVPINKVKASVRTNPIIVSQPHVLTKKDFNSNSNGYPNCLWCINSGCSKHMTENLKLLINFVWIRFGNDHVAAVLGYGDLQWGNILITRVYFVEGLGHNLFSVGQFCDSDLEVAFKRNTCYVRNLEGVDLLKRNHTTNLYTIILHEMSSASPICLMDRATSTKSWLWHQRLPHLNFDTINNLAKNDLVTGLPKFKYHKEHLCPSCEQGKSKKVSHPPKPVPNSKQRLHLLHMDLCGPMRVESTNGKWFVLVIVDDYSRYILVHFLRSKDEAPKEIKTFLKKITVLLQAPVIIVRTNNGTEFKNQVLKEYFDSVGISHQASYVRTPQQNGVVERRNRTLVEATRTMLIFFRASLFLWAKAIATACYTQNRFIIHRRFDKTPYELINGIKPNILFLHVFGALCYPKNDREDIGKLGAKGDTGFFICYSATSCAYRVYNRHAKKIMETMNVTFDELSVVAFEQRSSKLGLQSITSRQITMYDDYIGGQPSAAIRTVLAAQAPQDVDELKPQQQHVQQQDNQASLQPKIVADNVPNAMLDGNTFVNPFTPPSTSATESSSSQYVDPSNMHT
ncbi:retrovirus-related pol polyprotein from transposon TNT 1-94, partial [Tanacetum coccineum]